MELEDLKEKMRGMLLCHQEENAELRTWLESTNEQLRAAKATMDAAVDRLGKEVAEMMSRLERERSARDEVEDRLGRMLLDVGVQVERLRSAYRQASATMPAIGLNQFGYRVDFNERRLADLVSFFHFLSEELGHLRAALGAALDKEGVRAAIAVSARILSTLHHRDPFLPMSAILDELVPADQERELRAVAPISPLSSAWRRRGTSAPCRHFPEESHLLLMLVVILFCPVM